MRYLCSCAALESLNSLARVTIWSYSSLTSRGRTDSRYCGGKSMLSGDEVEQTGAPRQLSGYIYLLFYRTSSSHRSARPPWNGLAAPASPIGLPWQHPPDLSDHHSSHPKYLVFGCVLMQAELWLWWRALAGNSVGRTLWAKYHPHDRMLLIECSIVARWSG